MKRFVLTRPSYLPAELRGTAPYVPEGSDVAVWGWEAEGRIYGVAFAGNAEKPTWHYRFASREALVSRVRELADSRRAHAERIASRKAARKAFRHTIKVGDIFTCSWGYEQTNVDFYECVATKTKTIVVRAISGKTVSTDGGWTGYCVPQPGVFIGDARTVVVDESNGFKPRSYSHARLWNGQPERYSTYA